MKPSIAGGQWAMIMEYCPGGDLQQVLLLGPPRAGKTRRLLVEKNHCDLPETLKIHGKFMEEWDLIGILMIWNSVVTLCYLTGMGIGFGESPRGRMIRTSLRLVNCFNLTRFMVILGMALGFRFTRSVQFLLCDLKWPK